MRRRWGMAVAAIGTAAALLGAAGTAAAADLGQPEGIAVDAGHVYWTNSGVENSPATPSIGRANLETGQEVETSFIGLAGAPVGIAIDGSDLYWTSRPTSGPGQIGHATLAAAGPTDVDTAFVSDAGDFPAGIALDPERIYWSSSSETISDAERGDGEVLSSKLLGSEAGDGVAVSGTLIYWTNGGETETLDCAQLHPPIGLPDCPAVTDAGPGTPSSVAISGNRIFWDSGNSIASGVLRGGLGGGGEDVATIDDVNLSCVPGAAVVGGNGIAADAAHIYWVSTGEPHKIGRARVDCTGIEPEFVGATPPPSPPPASSSTSSPPSSGTGPSNPAPKKEGGIASGPTKRTKGSIPGGFQGELETPKQCVAGGRRFRAKVGVKRRGSARHKRSYSVGKVKFLLGHKPIATDRRKPFEVVYPGAAAGETLTVTAVIAVILKHGHRHASATRSLTAKVKICG